MDRVENSVADKMLFSESFFHLSFIRMIILRGFDHKNNLNVAISRLTSGYNATLWLIALPFPKQTLVFKCLQCKSFENTVGKGEIAQTEQFLLFPQCFLLN